MSKDKRLGPTEADRQRWHDEGAPVFDKIMERAKEILTEGDPPRVTLSDGTQVYPEHRMIVPETGMQKGYVVLADEERAKGFVRPYRDTYVHIKCGVVTKMGRTIAETYARDPFFYSGTYCAHCHAHFPVGMNGEFFWDGSKEKVGT